MGGPRVEAGPGFGSAATVREGPQGGPPRIANVASVCSHKTSAKRLPAGPGGAESKDAFETKDREVRSQARPNVGLCVWVADTPGHLASMSKRLALVHLRRTFFGLSAPYTQASKSTSPNKSHERGSNGRVLPTS